MTIRCKWRTAGLLCLAGSLLLALYSGRVVRVDASLPVLVLYWSAFIVLLMAALWMALLDVRYTRVEFKVRERELFQQTFLSEEFRQMLKNAREKDLPPDENLESDE